MADINDRLDRLHRREEFHRRVWEPAGEPAPPAPAAPDGGVGEVLDAVGRVVRRHPGLSVMVAIGDGRTGRPVIRVTERGGTVDTVVVAGAAAPATPPGAAPTPGQSPQHADRPGPEPGPNGRHAADPPPSPGRPEGVGESGESGGSGEPGEPGEPGEGAGVAPDPRQVVSRLAQLLREDPTLASTWAREARES